ncbi:hypothetical protein FA13DRAFT_1628065, partial [Coprinellus micaceus]
MDHSKTYEAKAISEAATIRAAKASPSGQHCLIENVPKEWNVEMAHVFAREQSRDSRQMKAIEWSWKMRKNTLNLDTRRNVFFLSPTMHSPYKSRKWALLPAEDVIERFFHKPESGSLRSMVDRHDFPEFSENQFQYTFLPLSADLAKAYITRQGNVEIPSHPDAVKSYRYPFTTFPVLTSHVHPTFVLLHLSRLLQWRFIDPYIHNLVDTVPLLDKISRLDSMW